MNHTQWHYIIRKHSYSQRDDFDFSRLQEENQMLTDFNSEHQGLKPFPIRSRLSTPLFVILILSNFTLCVKEE